MYNQIDRQGRCTWQPTIRSPSISSAKESHPWRIYRKILGQRTFGIEYSGLSSLCAPRASPRCSRPRWTPPCWSLRAQLYLTTASTLIFTWLRVTEVSSTLQTAVEAWQRGCRGNFCHACHGYACMVLRFLAWPHRSFNFTPNSRKALAGSSRSTAHIKASYTCCGVYKIQKDALLQFSSPVTPFTSNHLLNHNQSLATFHKIFKRSLNRYRSNNR